VRASYRALLLAVAVAGFAGCGRGAALPESAGIGPRPTVPPPNPTLIPTIEIAPAKGWPRPRDAHGGPRASRWRVEESYASLRGRVGDGEAACIEIIANDAQRQSYRMHTFYNRRDQVVSRHPGQRFTDKTD